MKNCTPLWRKAHFQVKMYKTPQCRTTFGSCDVGKVHAVVARSTFRSENVQSTSASDSFWKLRCRKSARRCGAKHICKWKCTKNTTFGPLLRCRKSARRCGAKHISKSKCTKHLSVGRLLEVEMWKKCTPLWREAHLEVKMFKTLGVRTTFGSSDLEKVHAVLARSTSWSQNVKTTRGSDHFWRLRCRFRVAEARACGSCQKWAKHEGFAAFRQKMAGMGHLKMICIFRGRRSTKDMFMREVGRSGCWFPERGYTLESQKCRFAKMILHDRCSISYDLAASFRGRRSTLDRWSRKIAKRIGTRVWAQHWSFHFRRKSRRSRSSLMLRVSRKMQMREKGRLAKNGGRRGDR